MRAASRGFAWRATTFHPYEYLALPRCGVELNQPLPFTHAVAQPRAKVSLTSASCAS